MSRARQLSAKHEGILGSRGIDPEVLSRHAVFSHDGPGGGSVDWIGVPYIREGIEISCKYRTITGEKKFYQKAGAGGGRMFFNHDALTDPALVDEPALIFEGELDAMVAESCGYPRSLSWPDGAPDTPEERPGERDAKYAAITETWEQLKPIVEFVLATDGDGPGHILRDELAVRLGKPRCRWIQYPKCTTFVEANDKQPGDRLKDITEVWREYGVKGVHAVLQNGKWMPVPGLWKLGDLPPLEERRRYKTGFGPVVDQHFQLRLGDLSVLTGIPGHGKSTFVNDLACRMAEQYDWLTCFCSPEQDPRTDHRRALRRWYWRKPAAEQTDEQRANADEWIDRHFSFVIPSEDDEATLDFVLEAMAGSVMRHGAKLGVIDPWNELDLIRPKEMSQTEFIGYALKSMKRFARRLGIHLMVLAHPTKQRRLDDGTFAVPSLYDIADSAHFYNKPDGGMVIHRQDITSKDLLWRMSKSRYWDQIGRPGDVKMTFNDYQGRFEVTDGTH